MIIPSLVMLRLVSGYGSWKSNPVIMKHLITFHLLFSLTYDHCLNLLLFISVGVTKQRLPLLLFLPHFQPEFFSKRELILINQKYLVILKYIYSTQEMQDKVLFNDQFSELLPQLLPTMSEEAFFLFYFFKYHFELIDFYVANVF